MVTSIQPAEYSLSPDDPTPILNKRQRAELLSAVAAHQTDHRVCPVCGLAAALDQATCARCGENLLDPNRTIPATLPIDARGSTMVDAGDAILSEQTPIMLLIGGAQCSLPIARTLTIGRQSAPLNASQPHVDLTPYQAWEAGVSRLHVRIRRESTLAYVTDLGSSNGTYLNGRRLEPGTERLLRNGDRLQLSQLSIEIRFQEPKA
jgi:hypothetical protein